MNRPTAIDRAIRAFTLVEILIVVVLLGIMAAIVVPQFANAAADGYTGNLQAQLSQLQRQIELYYSRNNAYPDLSANWNDLRNGGYIKNLPHNPAFNAGGGVADDSVSVVTGTTSGSTTSAFVWNSTHNIICASNFKEVFFFPSDADKDRATQTPTD